MAHDHDSRYIIYYYICSESNVGSESVVTSKIYKYIKNCFHCFRVTPPLALISGETKSKPAKKIKKISSLCERLSKVHFPSTVKYRHKIKSNLTNQFSLIKSRDAHYQGMLLVEWIME